MLILEDVPQMKGILKKDFPFICWIKRRRKFKLKSGGNLENNEIIEEKNKKIDFENIKFRKIVKKSNKNENIKNSGNTKVSKNNDNSQTQENVNKFENKEFDKYILEMQ